MGMETASLLGSARKAAGFSQEGLAALAGTSRPTLSAYENGRKSPSLETAQRILDEAGFQLAIEPAITFRQVGSERGRAILVPHPLPSLPLPQALAIVTLPLHLDWSDPRRQFDLRDRRQRGIVYERVLREGEPADVLTYIDGALLVDIWDELVLPVTIRAAWHDVVSRDAPSTVA